MNSTLKNALLTLSLLLLVACEKKHIPPAADASQGLPIAKVGNRIITDRMLLERIQKIEKSFPRVYSTHVQKKNLLTEMMNIELLYDEAIQHNVDKRYEFKSRMADLYVQDLSEQARATVNDSAIERYYEKNKRAIDRIAARHILLKTHKAMSDDEMNALKKKLEGYRQELLKKPDQFSEYAKSYSEDGSKGEGGDLGYFTFEMMVEPFSKAAFGLKNIGEISSVVKTTYGYHLIQLSVHQRGLVHYRDLVVDQLLRNNQKERLESELARLKKKNELIIYEDNLAQLSKLPNEILQDPESLVPHDATSQEKNETKQK